MPAPSTILQRVIFWFAGDPRVQLPSGERIPESWIADCLPGGDVPAALAGQAHASSIAPPVANLRQCEPWRTAPVAVGQVSTMRVTEAISDKRERGSVLVKPAVRSQSSQSSARPTPATVISPAADRA